MEGRKILGWYKRKEREGMCSVGGTRMYLFINQKINKQYKKNEKDIEKTFNTQ